MRLMCIELRARGFIFLLSPVGLFHGTQHAGCELLEREETAVSITYDDSDGWYGDVTVPILNQADVSDDQLLGPANCGIPNPVDARTLWLWSAPSASRHFSLGAAKLRGSRGDRFFVFLAKTVTDASRAKT